MTSRRREAGRRRRRERRKESRERPPSEPRAAAPPPPRQEPAARIGVSWLGLAGALGGIIPLTGIAVGVLVEPPEAGRWVVAAPLAMAAVYLPAVWASLSRTPRRRTVQRVVVAVSIVMVLAGLPFFGAALAVVLLPATGLLAVAAGLLFSR